MTRFFSVFITLGAALFAGCYSSEPEVFDAGPRSQNQTFFSIDLEVEFRGEISLLGNADHNTALKWYPCFSATWDPGDASDPSIIPFEAIAVGGIAEQNSNGDGSYCRPVANAEDVEFEIVNVDFGSGHIEWCSSVPVWEVEHEGGMAPLSRQLSRGRGIAPPQETSSQVRKDFNAAIAPIYSVAQQELTGSWSETCVPLMIETSLTMNRPENH